MRINMYSTSMDGTCGIGIYTKSLTNTMKKYRPKIEISHILIDRTRRSPFYFLRKVIELSKNCDIAHVQFEYDFFERYPITGFYIPMFFTFLKMLSYFNSFKIVVTMHNVWEVKNPPKHGKLGVIYIFIMNKFVTAFSDTIIVLSKVVENRLIDQSVQKNKIFLMPHGLEEPIFMDKQECKEKLEIKPKKILVTIFGYVRLNNCLDIKGHDLFVRVAKDFNDDVTFLIAGDGQTAKEREYLRKMRENIDNKVKFHGFVKDEDIPVVLNATDVMVLPYREASVSGILNWSLAYQIPTVTSDLAYFKEINKEYACIHLVRKDDPKELTEGIKTLLYNKNEVKRLKERSKYYSSMNSYRIVAEKTVDLYIKLTDMEIRPKEIKRYISLRHNNKNR